MIGALDCDTNLQNRLLRMRHKAYVVSSIEVKRAASDLWIKYY